MRKNILVLADDAGIRRHDSRQLDLLGYGYTCSCTTEDLFNMRDVYGAVISSSPSRAIELATDIREGLYWNEKAAMPMLFVLDILPDDWLTFEVEGIDVIMKRLNTSWAVRGNEAVTHGRPGYRRFLRTIFGNPQITEQVPVHVEG